MAYELDIWWDGWQPLYEEYVEKLISAGAEIYHVKEKYGGLRFETEDNDNPNQAEVWRLISEAEDKSFKICQDCGNAGKPQKLGGWIRTVCLDCAKKYT